MPVVSNALGSALAILEAARNPEVRAALGRATAVGKSAVEKTGLVGSKPSPGPAATSSSVSPSSRAAGIAYAAWQTLRADDDLWIDDEELTEPSGDVQPS